MPSTVNGIGTWYYGKKNLQTRAGTCSQCGKFATLSNYDTRLYFVVIFVPIIPLGKKHIVEECSLCRRHRAADLKNWEESRKKALEKGMTAMRERPDDPRSAMELHQAYLVFDQVADADKMMAHLKESFPTDFSVFMYLGSALESRNRNVEANECFKQALVIDPNNPTAQRAVGMVLLEEKKIDDGAKMLEPFTQDDTKFDAGATYALAKSYHAAHRHDEALKAFKTVAKRSPVMKKDPIFKKLVRASEISLGRKDSILPPKSWHEYSWAPIPIIAALVLMVLAYNYYASYHRKVYVISGARQPITVSIQGGPTVTVRSGQHVAIDLAEGSHTVTYSGGATGTQTFTVPAEFIGRMNPYEIVCLNAGNSAVLLWEETTYSNSSNKPYVFRLHFGGPLLIDESIDYAFEPFPSSISTKQSSETRKRLSLLTLKPHAVFASMIMQHRPAEALEYAEWYGAQHPEDFEFAQLYLSYTLRDQAPRALAYVAARCAERPIQVVWHRLHQDLSSSQKDRAALLAEYTALLAAEKENPDALYLRSRVCATASESMPMLKQALEKQPKHGFALSSSAFHKIHRGEWEEAWPLATAAIAEVPTFARSMYIEAAYGSKHLKELETLLSAEKARSPEEEDVIEELGRVLVAEGREQEAVRMADALIQNMRVKNKKENDYEKGPLATVHYAAADFKSLDKLTANVEALKEWRVVLAQENDDVAQLEALTTKDERVGPFDALLFALTFKLGGKPELAKEWRDRALVLLENDREEGPLVLGWLTASDAPRLVDVLDLSLENRSQLIVLAVLADQFPRERAAYLKVLSEANVVPKPPYHWLKRLNVKLSR